MEDFIKKLVDALEIENASSITGSTDFRTLEEWGSLATLSLIAMFDEEYGKEIDPSEIRNAKTIEDLYKLTEK